MVFSAKIHKWLLFTVTAFFLITCRTYMAVSPEESFIEREVPAKPSQISIPISITKAELKTLLDDALAAHMQQGDILYSKSGEDLGYGIKLQTTARLSGNTGIGMNNNRIEFSIPIHIDLRVDWSVDLIVGKLRHHENTSIDFTATGSLRPDVNSDYTIEPNINVSYDLHRPAKIQLGPIEINLESVTEKALAQQMHSFEKEMTDFFHEKMDIKTQMDKIWREIHKPLQISGRDDLWLVSQIRNVYASPIKTTEEAATIWLGVKGVFKFVLGTPPESTEVPPLPLLEHAPSASAMTINLPVEIAYSALERESLKRLNEQDLNVEGNTIIIKDLEIYPAGAGSIVIGLDAKIKKRGWFLWRNARIYMQGDPHFNPRDNELSLSHLEYDINTESLLLKMAFWALSPDVKEKIQKSLHYDMGELIQTYFDDLNSSFSRVPIKNLGTLQGNFESYTISDIILTKESFSIILELQGSAELAVEGSLKGSELIQN